MKFEFKKPTKKQIIIGSLFLVVIAIFVVIFIKLLPLINSLQEEETKSQFENWVSSLGPWGVMALLLCQVIQIILFFLPGEIFEFTSGLLYGALEGYLIVLCGQIISIMIVYLLFALFGNKVANALVGKETMDKMKKNETRSEVILFFCMLLPGIPKDIFYYAAPSCKIPMWKFIIISSIARIPSSIPSVLAGASIGNGNFWQSAVVMIISGIIAISGIVFNKQIVSFIENLKNRKSKKNRVEDVQE